MNIIDIPYKVSGVYLITNKINDKVYVGCSIDIHKRLKEHRNGLNLGNHRNRLLQNSWNKYGENSFLFDILVECDTDLLLSEENYWCNVLLSHDRKYGYNIRMTSPEGKTSLSEETKKILSDLKKGKGSYNYGKKMSEETKKKISIALSGKKASEKSKTAAAENGRKSKGRKHSLDTRMKMSERKKNKKLSEETKKKISDANKNRVISDEKKKLISDKLKGKKYNRCIWKVYNETSEYIVNSSSECLKILGISKSKRTTIYEVIRGRRDNINGFKIIDLKK